MHAEALPDDDKNPYGNGFVGVETPLSSESKASRVCDATKGTYWKVNNPASRHPSTGLLLLRLLHFHLTDLPKALSCRHWNDNILLMMMTCL